MTDRQKKGVAFIATAALFAVAGGVLLAVSATPAWVTGLIDGAVAVLAIFGIVVTSKPDV